MSTLQLCKLDASQVEEAARLHLRAFSQDPALNSIFPSTASSPVWLQYMCDRFQASLEDPSQSFIAMVDTTSGEIVSIATWILSAPKNEEEKPRPNKDVAFPEGSDYDLLASYREQRGKAKREIIGDRQCYYLVMLATDPAHQGKGAARELLQWGVQRATEDGLPAYLEASDSGMVLYRKLGFVEARQLIIKPADAESASGPVVTYAMVREPGSN